MTKIKLSVEEMMWNVGIENLTVMQQTTLEEYRKNGDIVLLSPTGSGKTLAYLLPLALSLDSNNNELQAVVMVPSRELALQIENVFKKMSTGIRVMSCYGGRPAMDEHRQMMKSLPQLIVATPGRMNDHLQKNNIGVEQVRTLVIDEFDKCLELGFHDQMSNVIEQLPHINKRFLLSATDAVAIPEFVSTVGFNKLNFLVAEEQIPDRIEVFQVVSQEKDKLGTLQQLLLCMGQERTMVFVNYRESVARVCNFLNRNGIYAEMFHGGMEQRDRERALYKFSNGSANVFVSTDLAARGLDIEGVDNVVHYHLPLNEEAYIHRGGRTARWDATGKAFVILGPQEVLPEYIDSTIHDYIIPSQLPRPAQPEWITLYIGKGKKDKLGKIDIVGFLTKIGGLKGNEIGRIDVKDHYAFVAIARKKVKTTLQQVQGQKIKGLKTIIQPTK